MTNPNASAIAPLLDIMAQLRDRETGCPWDIEQTFETIAPYTLEEAYEVEHAIRTGDMDALRDELGDLLLQVVFHAQMADEAGHFDFADVANAICEKLVRRHPHVFVSDAGDGTLVHIETAEEQTDFWEEAKAKERAERGGDARRDPFEGIPTALPALARAAKVQKRASRLPTVPLESEPTFDLEAFDRALDELVTAQSSEPANAQILMGRLLDRCVAAARKLGVDPEDALRAESHAFESRVKRKVAEEQT